MDPTIGSEKMKGDSQEKSTLHLAAQGDKLRSAGESGAGSESGDSDVDEAVAPLLVQTAEAPGRNANHLHLRRRQG